MQALYKICKRLVDLLNEILLNVNGPIVESFLQSRYANLR